MTNEPDIPRAMSVDPTDPHYRADCIDIGSRLVIWLDGVEQRFVRTYDLDEGFVVRMVLDSEGHTQINPEVPDEVWVEKVHGVVEVTIKGEGA